MNSRKEVFCTIVHMFEGRLTKPTFQGVLYLFDRKYVHDEGVVSNTQYDYTKTSWGVSAGKQFTNDLADLVNNDILYENTDVHKHPSNSYTIDHRSRFERIIDEVPSDVQEQIAAVCQTVTSAESVRQELRSLPEVSAADKYERLEFNAN